MQHGGDVLFAHVISREEHATTLIRKGIMLQLVSYTTRLALSLQADRPETPTAAGAGGEQDWTLKATGVSCIIIRAVIKQLCKVYVDCSSCAQTTMQ